MISSLWGGTEARFSCPPSLSSFSYKITSCPLMAETLAASMPAGPPPTTRTLFGTSAFSILYSSSLPKAAFTEHAISSSKNNLLMHSSHAVHRLISSRAPAAAFFGKWGSASKALPMETRSAFPCCRISSASSGSLILPTVITGTLTTPFISAAKCTM